MTWREMFQRLLGQRLDEEIDVEAETGAQGNPEGAGGDSGTGADTGAGEPANGSGGDSGGAEGGDPGTDENNNEEDNNVPVFNEGWFNPQTMTFDPSKISDEATRNALQTVADAIRENNNALAIERAINDQIARSNIAVSPETFRRCLNTEGIKVGTDGKVTGVTEAFEALRKSDAKLFIDSKENSPLNEGFSPVNKTNASNNFKSFAEALEAEKALN